MSKKQYQISPIELAQWAEPLFGFGEGKAKGFSEKKIAAFEAEKGVKLPAALREYYLTCGKASLNSANHEMLTPDKSAKLMNRITFTYELMEEDLETFKKDGEEDYEELAKLRVLPRERWGEVLDNYLLILVENQGCYYVGIKAEDLSQPNPKVYYSDDLFSWAEFSDSVQSFILTTLIGHLKCKAFPDEIVGDPDGIQKALLEGGVDFNKLCKPYPFPGGRFAHTCLDTENNVLYVYGEEAKDRPAYLQIFKQDEEE